MRITKSRERLTLEFTMSKIGHITIEVPLPDDASLEELEILSKVIELKALTRNPDVTDAFATLSDVKVFGKVIHYGWHRPGFLNGHA